VKCLNALMLGQNHNDRGHYATCNFRPAGLEQPIMGSQAGLP